MKTLHDGTEVSDETPTKLVNGKRYLLMQEEIAAREAEAQAAELASLKPYLSELRNKAEFGAITVTIAENTNITFNVDNDSKANLIGLFLKAQDPAFTTSFKHSEGTIDINATQALMIANAVFNQAQDSFRAVGVVEPLIDDGTYTTKEQVKTAFDEEME